mmetsp:Transcript_30928/g.49699  ORF Transcript_30928/g.49699 Transcript_30928/m.49699 type:complete len:484 (+) Transcript_30928:436-1887(+)
MTVVVPSTLAISVTSPWSGDAASGSPRACAWAWARACASALAAASGPSLAGRPAAMSAGSSPPEPPRVMVEISWSTRTISEPSSSACSVRRSRTQSRRSWVEPTSSTVPSSWCSMMGIALGFGIHESITSTSTTSLCRLSCSASTRLLPYCHTAFASGFAAVSSMMTYLYSYVSSAWIGVVTVHTFFSVQRMGNASSTFQSFQVPTMATRCPGSVATTISNLTGMSASPFILPWITRPICSLWRSMRSAFCRAMECAFTIVSSSARMLHSISHICASCVALSSRIFSLSSADSAFSSMLASIAVLASSSAAAVADCTLRSASISARSRCASTMASSSACSAARASEDSTSMASRTVAISARAIIRLFSAASRAAVCVAAVSSNDARAAAAAVAATSICSSAASARTVTPLTSSSSARRAPLSSSSNARRTSSIPAAPSDAFSAAFSASASLATVSLSSCSRERNELLVSASQSSRDLRHSSCA